MRSGAVISFKGQQCVCFMRIVFIRGLTALLIPPSRLRFPYGVFGRACG